MTFNDFLDIALKESSYKEDSDNNIRCLKTIADSYQNSSSETISETIMDLINELSLLTPADDFDPKADAVTLMTMHTAKGLEFMIVFITGVEEGLIPYTMKNDDSDIEEERRLFYVGMTRAKEELFLIHARNRFLYGQRLVQSPSPLIGEILEEFIGHTFIPDRIKKTKKESQIGLF